MILSCRRDRYGHLDTFNVKIRLLFQKIEAEPGWCNNSGGTERRRNRTEEERRRSTVVLDVFITNRVHQDLMYRMGEDRTGLRSSSEQTPGVSVSVSVSCV